MRYPQIKQLAALPAYVLTTGTPVQPFLDPNNGPVVLLATPGTYVIPLGDEKMGHIVETAVASMSAKWPTGIVGSITLEGTNFPRTRTGSNQGPDDISEWDSSAAWQQINPALAGAIWAQGSGTGTMTAFTCAVTSGAGGGFWNFPGVGCLRLRMKLALTTGGPVRVLGHSKLGS